MTSADWMALWARLCGSLGERAAALFRQGQHDRALYLCARQARARQRFWEAAGRDDCAGEEIDELRERCARLERERDESREAGRRKGRAEVGKYSNAIGRIEGALGITGAVPLGQTVQAVERLRDRCASLEAALREAHWMAGHLCCGDRDNGDRDAWALVDFLTALLGGSPEGSPGTEGTGKNDERDD